jgi:hypothetical protein
MDERLEYARKALAVSGLGMGPAPVGWAGLALQALALVVEVEVVRVTVVGPVRAMLVEVVSWRFWRVSASVLRVCGRGLAVIAAAAADAREVGLIVMMPAVVGITAGAGGPAAMIASRSSCWGYARGFAATTAAKPAIMAALVNILCLSTNVVKRVCGWWWDLEGLWLLFNTFTGKEEQEYT